MYFQLAFYLMQKWVWRCPIASLKTSTRNVELCHEKGKGEGQAAKGPNWAHRPNRQSQAQRRQSSVPFDPRPKFSCARTQWQVNPVLCPFHPSERQRRKRVNSPKPDRTNPGQALTKEHCEGSTIWFFEIHPQRVSWTNAWTTVDQIPLFVINDVCHSQSTADTCLYFRPHQAGQGGLLALLYTYTPGGLLLQLTFTNSRQIDPTLLMNDFDKAITNTLTKDHIHLSLLWCMPETAEGDGHRDLPASPTPE